MPGYGNRAKTGSATQASAGAAIVAQAKQALAALNAERAADLAKIRAWRKEKGATPWGTDRFDNRSSLPDYDLKQPAGYYGQRQAMSARARVLRETAERGQLPLWGF